MATDINTVLGNAFSELNQEGDLQEQKLQNNSSNLADDKKTVFRLRIFGIISIVLAIASLVFVILTVEDTKKCESQANLQCPCFTNPNSSGPYPYSTTYTDPSTGDPVPLNCLNNYK